VFELLPFYLLQSLKTLILIVMTLLALKGIRGLRFLHPPLPSSQRVLRGAAVGVILFAALWGGYGIGRQVAARAAYLTGQRHLAKGDNQSAYSAAVWAVRLRSGELRYWRQLTGVKMRLRQFSSALQDMPAYRELGNGKIDAEDQYRFAGCRFFLEEYDPAIALLEELVKKNPYFPAPQLMLGRAQVKKKNYPQAEAVLLNLLQRFPSHPLAVEGLARILVLQNRKADAVTLLQQTKKVSFPPSVRRHFQELMSFYAE